MKKLAGDADEYNRIIKKASAYAKRFGFGDESDDFAQEFAIKCFELGFEAKLDWFLKDYSGKCRTSKRLLSSPTGYLSKNVRVSLDQPIGNADDDGATIGDFIGGVSDDMELRDELRQYFKMVKGIINLAKNKEARKEIMEIYSEHIDGKYELF